MHCNNLQINHLEKHNNNIYSEIVIVKYMLLISIILTILMAIFMGYVLQVDIKNLIDQQKSCRIPRDT